MSIILHGMSANPVMNALNRRQQRQEN